MAMLCAVAARDDDTPLILLLVEGASIGLSSALVDAVEMYVPVATVWVYEDADSPQLRAVDRRDVERWSRRASSEAPARRAVDDTPDDARSGGWSEPTLKLVDGPTGGADPDEPEPDDNPDNPGPPSAVHTPVAVEPGSGTGRAAASTHPEHGPFAETHGAESAPSIESPSESEAGFDGPAGLTDDELSMLLADDWDDPNASPS